MKKTVISGKDVLISITLFLFLISSPLFSADFTFKVPVELKNMCPEMEKITVHCMVKTGTDFGSGEVVGGTSSGYVMIPQDGNLSTVVTVKVNAQFKSASEGNYYRCTSHVWFKDGSSAIFHPENLKIHKCPVDESPSNLKYFVEGLLKPRRQFNK